MTYEPAAGSFTAEQATLIIGILSEILENEAAVKGMLEMFRSEIVKVVTWTVATHACACPTPPTTPRPSDTRTLNPTTTTRTAPTTPAHGIAPITSPCYQHTHPPHIIHRTSSP